MNIRHDDSDSVSSSYAAIMTQAPTSVDIDSFMVGNLSAYLISNQLTARFNVSDIDRTDLAAVGAGSAKLLLYRSPMCWDYNSAAWSDLPIYFTPASAMDQHLASLHPGYTGDHPCQTYSYDVQQYGATSSWDEQSLRPVDPSTQPLHLAAVDARPIPSTPPATLPHGFAAGEAWDCTTTDEFVVDLGSLPQSARDQLAACKTRYAPLSADPFYYPCDAPGYDPVAPHPQVLGETIQ